MNGNKTINYIKIEGNKQNTINVSFEIYGGILLNMIILHVDIKKSHVYIIMLHVFVIHSIFVCLSAKRLHTHPQDIATNLPVIFPFGAHTSTKLFLCLTQWKTNVSPLHFGKVWHIFFRDLSCSVSLSCGQCWTICSVSCVLLHTCSCKWNKIILIFLTIVQRVMVPLHSFCYNKKFYCSWCIHH